ncbi:MAG TPA: hypothetical protein VNO55_23750 [Polyangia bacterium]|nr:hypothetical protein [Polyangia bacterium]
MTARSGRPEIWGALLLVVAGASGISGDALGAEVAAEAAPARTEVWQGTVALRTTLVRDRGFDPFATTDALPQLSLGVSRVLVRQGALALALGLAFDTGASDASARSAHAHLQVIRGSVPVELRVAPLARAYAFGRVAPGLMRVSASLVDSSSPATMSGDFSGLSLDASAGVAVRLSPDRSVVGVWIEGDAGYGWTPSHEVVLQPGLGGADQNKAGALTLAPLAARGAFGRLGLAVTY